MRDQRRYYDSYVKNHKIEKNFKKEMKGESDEYIQW